MTLFSSSIQRFFFALLHQIAKSTIRFMVQNDYPESEFKLMRDTSRSQFHRLAALGCFILMLGQVPQRSPPAAETPPPAPAATATLKVELFAENPANTERLKMVQLRVYLQQVSPPAAGVKQYMDRLTSPPDPTRPLEYEFKNVPRGVLLMIGASGDRWSGREPILLEGGKEVFRGSPFMLPASGPGSWSARLGVRRLGERIPAGTRPFAIRGPMTARLRFIDALTSHPVAGVSVQILGNPMGEWSQGSDPDGLLTLQRQASSEPCHLNLKRDFMAVKTSQGGFAVGDPASHLILPLSIFTSAGTPETVEISVVPVLDGKIKAIQVIDGIGKPVREGVTIIDGPLRWPMSTGEIPGVILINPGMERAGYNPLSLQRGLIGLAKWRQGKARLYFKIDEHSGYEAVRRASDYPVSDQALQPAIDPEGRPCLDVDFERLTLSSPLKVQLINHLEMPREEGARP